MVIKPILFYSIRALQCIRTFMKSTLHTLKKFWTNKSIVVGAQVSAIVVWGPIVLNLMDVHNIACVYMYWDKQYTVQ